MNDATSFASSEQQSCRKTNDAMEQASLNSGVFSGELIRRENRKVKVLPGVLQ